MISYKNRGFRVDFVDYFCFEPLFSNFCAILFIRCSPFRLHDKSGDINPQFQNIINIENARPRSSDSRSSLAVIKEEDFEHDKGGAKKHAKVHPNEQNYRIYGE